MRVINGLYQRHAISQTTSFVQKNPRAGECWLTFKATLLSDSQLRLAGFVELTPLIPFKDGEARRQIWAAQDVYDLLKGKLNPAAGFPAIKTDVFIGKYCKGYIVTVSRRDSSKAEFKWFKGHEQVWALSFRKPAPGWRVLGRFARKNVFVAMEAYDRHELGGMIQYNAIAGQIPANWDAKFPGVAPYTGGTFADYVGDMHWNDDEQH
jgi:hypothetical protein